MKEKRRNHRMNIEIPVSFEGDGSECLIFASTLDISATGLSLRLNDPVAVGKMLKLTIGLDDDKMVKVEAQVVWIKEKKVENDKSYYEVGVKIIDKMDQDEIDFVRFIAKKMFEHFASLKEERYDEDI